MIDFTTIRGIAETIGVIIFLGLMVYQAQKALNTQQGVINHQQAIINALVDGMKQIDNTPATLAAIKGATDNIPPQFFDRVLSFLTTAGVFLPNDKSLFDAFKKFIADVEPTPAPVPDQTPAPGPDVGGSPTAVASSGISLK